MKKFLFAKFYFIVFVISTLFMLGIFSNCGTAPQLPKEVCVYTDMVCEFSELICEAYPEYCWYVNITCVNLTILCDTTATQIEKEFATDILKENNKQFKKQLRESE